jgi:nicotinamidase-related amidase
MTHAVLVIDVQQGLCEGEGAAHDCAGTIDRINALTRKARAADVPVLFVQHESASGYLERGTHAWQLARGLDVQPGDSIIRKTTPDAFLRTGLQETLHGLGVTELVICGMHTEFCVDTTTRRALALGYPVVLVSDAHTSAGNLAISAAQVISHHNATLTSISSFGPRVRAVPHGDVEFADLPVRAGQRRGPSSQPASALPPEDQAMTKYLISFPAPAMDIPDEDWAEVSEAAHAVIREAKHAGVYVFGGGINEEVGSLMVAADGGVTNETYPQTRELNGGFCVLELPSRDAAIEWAAKIAKACRCSQELREFLYDPES